MFVGKHQLPVLPACLQPPFGGSLVKRIGVRVSKQPLRIRVKSWARDPDLINKGLFAAEISNIKVDVQEKSLKNKFEAQEKSLEIKSKVQEKSERTRKKSKQRKRKSKKKRSRHHESPESRHSKHRSSRHHHHRSKQRRRIVRIPGGPEFDVPFGITCYRVLHEGCRFSLYLDSETGLLQKYTRKRINSLFEDDDDDDEGEARL